MMEQYGMDSNGLIVFPVESEKYKSKKEDAIIELVDDATKSTEKIISENKELIIIIANILHNKKTILSDELYKIIDDYDKYKRDKIGVSTKYTEQINHHNIIGISE